jgi:hypothetical protein
VAGEEVDHLGESHPLVVVRVHLLKQVLHFLLSFYYVHFGNEVSEFVLVDDAVVVKIGLLEELGKPVQELLMLLKLEVKNSFLEVVVAKLFPFS